MDKINEFREKLRLTNIKGLALDIDETLADSNYAWFESMFKFKSFHLLLYTTKSEPISDSNND